MIQIYVTSATRHPVSASSIIRVRPARLVSILVQTVFFSASSSFSEEMRNREGEGRRRDSLEIGIRYFINELKQDPRFNSISLAKQISNPSLK